MFAGCGGMDLGFVGKFSCLGRKFSANPFDIQFAADFDPEVVDLYNQNPKLLNGNCTKIDVREIVPGMLSEFDLMTAGFPCQPFSNAGKRRGVHDDDGRGVLFEECERIIRECQQRSAGEFPLGFVFENVKGILSTRMPNGRTVPEEIVCRMKRLGFNTAFKLLRASDFGVPQNRERVLMVGFREDLPVFDFSSLERIVRANKLPSARVDPYELTIGWWLSTIDPMALNQSDYWKYSPGSQKMIDSIGPCADGAEALGQFRKRIPLGEISATITTGRSWKNIPIAKLAPRFRRIHDDPKRYHAPNFYRRFALGEICGTITASAQPENAGITHPFENRRYTVREIARIQSFPDCFDFTHSRVTAPYKGIGNAVPPVLAWVLARAIANHLEPTNKLPATKSSVPSKTNKRSSLQR